MPGHVTDHENVELHFELIFRTGKKEPRVTLGGLGDSFFDRTINNNQSNQSARSPTACSWQAVASSGFAVIESTSLVPIVF